MSKENDGGPAFPTLGQDIETEGMTLRDYFAVHANAEDILAQTQVLRASEPTGVLPDNWTTKARYMHADAMLAARHAGVTQMAELEIKDRRIAELEAIIETAGKQEVAYYTRQQFGKEREICEKPFTADWERLYTHPDYASAQRIRELEEKLRIARNALQDVEGMLDEVRGYPITHDAVIEALAIIGEEE